MHLLAIEPEILTPAAQTTRKTQAFYYFSFASLASVATLALNPFWPQVALPIGQQHRELAHSPQLPPDTVLFFDKKLCSRLHLTYAQT